MSEHLLETQAGVEVTEANEALATNETVETTETNGFTPFNLLPELFEAVRALGFTQPTPVQTEVLSTTLQHPQDLMVSSQTGSGKTAAFLIPAIQNIILKETARIEGEAKALAALQAAAAENGQELPKKPKRKNPTDARNFKPARPLALVLCPTRELAQQVANDAIELVRFTKHCRIANIVGGMPYRQQIAQLQNALLVVATPGRLLDLQQSGQILLDGVETLILDEADRMLDLGFSDDLNQIDKLTTSRSLTLMFSATFAQNIMRLGGNIMRNPRRIELQSAQDRNLNIAQRLYWSDSSGHQRQILDNLLRDPSIDQAIVFAPTQISCDDLAADLEQAGFSAIALHGGLSQGLRNRRLAQLRSGRVQMLVATDVAARGIDVPTISHVFNWGLPMKPEDYVHRIGRTGRAGRNGDAITIVQYQDRRKITALEQFLKSSLNVAVVEGMEPTLKAAKSSRGAEGRGNFGGRGDRRRDSNDGYASFGTRNARPARNGFSNSGGNSGNGGGFSGDRGGRSERAPYDERAPRPERGNFNDRDARNANSFAPRGRFDNQGAAPQPRFEGEGFAKNRAPRFADDGYQSQRAPRFQGDNDNRSRFADNGYQPARPARAKQAGEQSNYYGTEKPADAIKRKRQSAGNGFEGKQGAGFRAERSERPAKPAFNTPNKGFVAPPSGKNRAQRRAEKFGEAAQD